MSKKFKALNQLTANEIDLNKITNNNLKNLLTSIITEKNGFLFFSRKGHEDHTEKIYEHCDDSYVNLNGEYVLPRYGKNEDKKIKTTHTDHADHFDHSEAKHKEYSESSNHTDSNSRDYTESVHTDKR